MRVPILIFILTNLCVVSMAHSEVIPSWITKGPMSDSTFHYVICSHDGIDPEEARQIAESKCLASAAKLGGVNVKLTQKTVQSLTGSDSSEVAEIQPLEANIKCEWTDRFLEKIKDGFRVWLRCKVSKNSATTSTLKPYENDNISGKPTKHIDSTLLLTTIPQVDRVILIGVGGERVIEPTSNVVIITITNLDKQVELNKIGYKRAIFDLPKILHQGARVEKSIVLQRD